MLHCRMASRRIIMQRIKRARMMFSLSDKLHEKITRSAEHFGMTGAALVRFVLTQFFLDNPTISEIEGPAKKKEKV